MVAARHEDRTAESDYELRHIEALRKNLAGCTVLLLWPFKEEDLGPQK